MENPTVVNTELTPPQGEEPKLPVAPKVEVTEPPIQPGDKTPPHLLLQSLQQARAKIGELEEKINELTSSPLLNNDIESDEGKALKKQIDVLTIQLEDLRKESAKKDILITYPILKDKMADFDEFRGLPENKGMNIKTAAKAFLVERGLLEPARKGLEKPTGGDKTPAPSGKMTAKEAETLRTTNFKKYTEMLQNGQIIIE